MNDERFALVKFQGSQLLTIFDGGTVRVAMKPLVEALGIGWGSQYQKIVGDPVLSKGITLSVIPSERGAQETLTLPIDLMQGWLFKLNPERVAPEARDRVIAYQAECYQVLHDYWVKGAAINPRFNPGAQIEHSDRTARRRELPGLMERATRTKNTEELRILHALIVRACEVEGILPPAIEALAPTMLDDAEVEQLLTAIDALLRERPALDHHRREDLIAVRGKELTAAGVPIRKAIRMALKRHPRFVDYRAVNSARGIRSVKCWVFRAA